MIESLFFYLLAFNIIVASLIVITVKNTVHSVLWLIFAFFNAAGLFLLANAEFLAMLLIIVYVGAVAVLFLFVVMMLEIDTRALRAGFYKQLAIGMVIAGIFLFDLIILIMISAKKPQVILKPIYSMPVTGSELTNTQALGQILYTDFVLQFQVAGLILFTAMIGCIVLTLRRTSLAKKQNIQLQNARNKSTAIELVHNIGKDGIDV